MLHEFTVMVPNKLVDLKVELLNANGYYNHYYDQPIEQVIIPNGYGVIEKEDELVQLKIYFDEEINIEETSKELQSILEVEEIQYNFIETNDYQQPFPIVDLQNGWFIVPTSEEKPEEGKSIVIEPPNAFGTGLHPTTQDCLRFILDENFSGKSVLDLGTGSGILSIAASLVGAEKIIAIDIENVEGEVLYNARLNQVGESISVLQCDVLQKDFQMNESFDWIFINIGGDESKSLCSFVCEHLINGGKLLLSGMVEWNADEVCSYFEQFGFKLLKRVQSEEWVTALFELNME